MSVLTADEWARICLPRTEHAIVSALNAADALTMEEIVAAVYPLGIARPADPVNVIAVTLVGLRRRLEPLGLTISKARPGVRKGNTYSLMRCLADAEGKAA